MRIVMRMVNLTQHRATDEQKACGVFDLPPGEQYELCALLTFDELPDADELRQRAASIARLAKQENVRAAMIGGAPFFMPVLEQALADVGIQPVYAFSRRVSLEETDEVTGEVVKRSAFRHEGFVPAVLTHNER